MTSRNQRTFIKRLSEPALRVNSLRLSRREFLLLTGVVTAGTILSACTPPWATPKDKQKDTTQVVYQDWGTDLFIPMAQQMMEQFNSTHPNIRVFYTPDPVDYQKRMLADLQGGSAADVFQGCCTHLPAWARLGYTLDLRPYVEADLNETIINDWDQAQYMALFTEDGRQFALPKYHGALALYYNKDAFDEYGVDYPTDTWDYDDYLRAMKLLTHDRDGDGKTDLWGSMIDISWERIQVYVNSWGGHFVDPEDPRQCLMSDPEALQAMEWIRARMWDDRVMASRHDVQDMSTRLAFITEKVAMVEDGSWALKDILNHANFRIGVAPFPAGPARRATLATTDGFAIYSGSEHPEAAWELIKFLISKEYGRAMAQAVFLQPARASLLREWEGFIHNEFPAQVGAIDIAAFSDGHLKGYSVTIELLANMTEAKQIADEAWNEIFTLGRSPVTRMKDACRQIQKAQEI